ncbi:MAG: hypothetical protein LBU32_20760 [Clostridiales bacterium]|nr:hypothetical protein [Clostridiales bacterium]
MKSQKKLKRSEKAESADFKFKLSDVPFSRKLSYLFIDEGLFGTEAGSEKKQLRLYRMLRRYPEGTKNEALMGFRPMVGDRSVPYSISASPSLMEINTEHGYAQICFDNKDLIRIRGCGISLRFFSEFKPHEAFVSRLDGTCQASYDIAGQFLFAPIKGSLSFESAWDWKKCGSEDAVIDIIADESGAFEMAIHHAQSNAERQAYYRPFEECLDEAQKDYEDWLSMYPSVPGKYERTKKLCAYSVWICFVAPSGILKGNIVLFSKNSSALSWHQAYHAMAIGRNADAAVKIMRCIFDYQDEYGELPDLIDDQYLNILATKPPFQGFAFMYMHERMGDEITREHCETLYEPFVRWHDWWMTKRDTDHDGIPQYNQGCESGNDFTGMLSKGTPVECPDLISYIILLEESLGILAQRLGKAGEAAVWRSRAKRLLNVLTSEFWDGEKFIARLSGSHDIVESEEIDCYMPLMLGRRLPSEIVDKLSERLSDPEHYYSEIGLRSSPKAQTEDKGFPGFVMGFSQIKLSLGLYDAGKKKLARDIICRFLDVNLEQLPNFAYIENAESKPEGIEFGKCSALSSSIFLAMAGFLNEISRKA